MPTYAYHCEACDKEFEVSQRMSDAPIDSCECGAKGQVKRLVSVGAGVIFKGTGFYQTDYKGGSGSSSKSESKPEAAPSGGHTCGSPSCCMK